MFTRNSTVPETSRSVVEDLQFTASCGNTQATDQTKSVILDTEDPTENNCVGEDTGTLYPTC